MLSQRGLGLITSCNGAVGGLGWGTGLERSTLDGATYVALACRVLEVEPSVLGSARQDHAITRLRELVAAVGVERWGQRAGELGRVLGKHRDVVSRWARKAGQVAPRIRPLQSGTTPSTGRSRRRLPQWRKDSEESVGSV